MRRDLYSIFLLFLLASQMLPVQQIGNALFSNRITEEIPHSIEDDSGFSKKSDLKSVYLSSPSFSLYSFCCSSSFLHHTSSDIIPQNHAYDIHVPPPNC
jgi:hypothetical protein